MPLALITYLNLSNFLGYLFNKYLALISLPVKQYMYFYIKVKKITQNGI